MYVFHVGVEPIVNMPLEVLDEDGIWNYAVITRVTYSNNNTDASQPKCYVTVQYKGWSEKSKDILSYPNERLARVFTYTKTVKCLVRLTGMKKKAIFGKDVNKTGRKAKNLTDLWPCKVYFRRSLTVDLGDEKKAFVEPYMKDLLPTPIQKSIEYGGQWVDVSQLCPWIEFSVDDPGTSAGNFILYMLGHKIAVDIEHHVVYEFCVAYRTAQADWIKGKLTSNALVDNGLTGLLNEEYRVPGKGGDVVGGVRYSGSLSDCGRDEKKVQILRQYNALRLFAPSTASVMSEQTSVLPPISTSNIACPDQCVRRLPESNRWAGILHVSGNDIFIGSYTSRSEAIQAVQLASIK